MPVAAKLRATGRFSAFLVTTLFLMPFYKFGRSPDFQRLVAGLWFRCVGHIIGVKLQARGQAYPVDKGNRPEFPVLYVANHVSWLDIIVLGMKLDAVFVAKSDVADWPLLGRLASMRQCIFVSRQPVQVEREVRMIRERLASGCNVILFPEGTTGEGGRLLPFKSSLLAAVDGLPEVRVQAVSIAYPDPVNGGADTSLAWYGETRMLPHLWSVLGRADAPARLQFHPLLTASDFPCRKTLAAACRSHISGGIDRMLSSAQGRELFSQETRGQVMT